MNNDELREEYNTIIEYGNTHPHDRATSLHRLRQLILLEGLPTESSEEIEDRLGEHVNCSLRGTIWKILLNVKQIDTDKYVNLVMKGSPPTYQKIRNDIHRTFKNDEDYAKTVPQDKLIRNLSAFSHHCSGLSGKTKEISYVQGMNALCGAFLYVLPEVDAFFAFSTLILENCPQYVLPNLDGTHAGLDLLDLIILNADPELHRHLHANGYGGFLMMPAILSLRTATPPLGQVLRLWDFYFAFGVHMNVVCTAAQLILMRDELFSHKRPCSLILPLPPLDADTMITMAVHLVRQLPSKIYDLLVVHPTSPVQIPTKI